MGRAQNAVVGVPVPADPTVYVERVPSHTSCAWQAAGLPAFLDAVEQSTADPEPVVTVDTTTVGGRRQRSVAAVPTEDASYVRLDPSPPWRLAWERRTTPVVTLDGAVTVDLCRRLHRATTADTAWPDDAVDRLADLLAGPADDTPS